jgi:hypothetical protein
MNARYLLTIILSGNKTRQAQPISVVTFGEALLCLIKRMNPQKINRKSESMLIH